jgi:[ribosomal protein S5]-alanine N-acetyltransferase
MVCWQRHPNIRASRRLVAQTLVGYAQGGHYEWGLVRHADRAFLGTCGFDEIDLARGAAAIGYVLAKPYWGQGYATEAAAAVVDFGFVHLDLRRIEAQALSENVTSLRVMAKLGMRYREAKPSNNYRGASQPVCVWQIERERWSSGLLDGTTKVQRAG